jgi:N-methylhydantoinase A/oxoprolinase/acetone carboxylase beta subunit
MKSRHIHLIACGVLRVDFNALSEKQGFEYSTTWLEGGLHDRPAELRARLQEAVDEVEDADLIAVGYGLCGRGTVDIRAREIPLAIPRVHDCISLFLGSDEAYSKEFTRNPGTYYISAGWYKEKVQPRQASGSTNKPALRNPERSLDYLEEKYGKENAREINEFMSSWQRNYTRAVYIDTGSDKKAIYGEHAKAMADEFGWDYQRLDGSLNLLEALLSGVDDERILHVPPGYLTAFDPMTKKLTALPEAAITTADSEMGEAADAGGATENQPGAPAGTSASTAANAAASPAMSSHGMTGAEIGKGQKKGYGLGIDAGGTYTDIVVFDFERREVVSTAKALTTKWDYTVGINEALDRVNPRWWAEIELVAVSTTLATNAIVEGTGRTTGLILMPPAGITAEEFSGNAAVVSGRMDISGIEMEPVDSDEVKRVVTKMREQSGARAFAVSGYAGAINPAHEIMVRDLIIEVTGLDVCCGHELSDLLDFRVRAHTAVLNAGIIPLIERFLQDTDSCLADRGIKAPLMIVKGDGTLMQESRARLHPVETILSGPAASLAGAKYLTGRRDATAVDVGGTTSDIGRIDDGGVDVCARGAVVGRWRTHVRAVDMHTLGLGGDSEIFIVKQELNLGPKRVAPICWLAAGHDHRAAFDHIKKELDYYAADTRLAEMFVSTGRKPEFKLSDQETAVLDLLADKPMTAVLLVEALGIGHPALLQIDRLEADYIVQRCGLTPTDLLHSTGEVSLWDAEAAEEYLTILSLATERNVTTLRDEVFSLITERLMFELVKRQLPLEYTGEDLEDSATAKALFDTLLKGGNPHLEIAAKLDKPVIGLGAAASLFLAEPVRRLSAELLIPKHAEVANAVGAITSLVRVSRRGSISPSSDGTYLVSGVPGGGAFQHFQDAYDALVGILRVEVLKLAKDAGTDEQHIEVEYEDNVGAAADGTKIFIGRSVTAGVTGTPVGITTS